MAGLLELLQQIPIFQWLFPVMAVILASNLLRAYKAHRELSHIPYVGCSGFLTSYIGAFKHLMHGHEMAAEGCAKYPGRVFRIPTLNKWEVWTSSPAFVEDIKKAQDTQLDIRETGNDILQLTYTLGDEMWMNAYHVDIIRGPLTRNIRTRFPDIRDEVVRVCSMIMPPSKEWNSVRINETALQIVARASARFLVGYPLCLNDEYIDLSIKITAEVFLTGFVLSSLPGFLRPAASRLLLSVPKLIDRTMTLLGPIIKQREEMEEIYGNDWPGKPNDFISWLLDVKDQDRSLRNLTCRILSTNVAAIHTTSTALTWALYELAAHPESAPILREEIESVVKREGWTKAAMVQLRKLDSFIKESSRIYSSENGITRKTVQDFVFSDGTVVPKGHFIHAAIRSSYYDEKNYPNADEFQATRFSDMREHEGESIKHQMVTPEPDHLLFGVGKHACPGRFLAVNEVKLAMSQLLMNYDIRFAKKNHVPKTQWFIGVNGVDENERFEFRSRESPDINA